MSSKPSLDIVYLETRDVFVRQLSDIGGLDKKAGVIGGFGAAILTALVGMADKLPTLSGLVDHVFHPLVLPLVLATGAIAVFASSVCAVVALRTREYHDLVDPKAAFEHLADKPPDRSKEMLIAQWIEGRENNFRAMRQKATWIKVSLSLLVGALLAFTSATLLCIIAL